MTAAGVKLRTLIIALTAVTVLSTLLSACSGAHKKTSQGIAATRLVYSPNGEPLSGGPLGHLSCEAALAGWFQRLDSDRRGTINIDQYLSDARRQFAAMDLDKQGAITADQLTRYRAPYVSLSKPETAASADGSIQPPGFGQGAHRQAQPNTAPHAPAAGNPGGHSPDEEPDPVMAADVHLQFKVTLADFLAYADRKFVELNAKHDGRLAKTEVLVLCLRDRNR